MPAVERGTFNVERRCHSGFWPARLSVAAGFCFRTRSVNHHNGLGGQPVDDADEVQRSLIEFDPEFSQAAAIGYILRAADDLSFQDQGILQGRRFQGNGYSPVIGRQKFGGEIRPVERQIDDDRSRLTP